jgi:hypothetical protein
MIVLLHEASGVRKECVVAEPRNPTQAKLRDWPMFQTSPGRRKHERTPPASDGRALPRISELLMSHMQGAPDKKIEWLAKQKAAGKLDGDDPDEIAEAEALLRMLARMSEPKARKKHIDELLDDALKGTFPASDPVSVGHFAGTELR